MKYLARIVSLGLTLAFSAFTLVASSSISTTIHAQPTPLAASTRSHAAAAETLVRALYKAHDGKSGPFFQTKSRARVDKYFTKSLAVLIWNDSVASARAHEVGVIDGDPLYNAQDVEIKNFAVGRARVKADTAIVPVTFTNFGKKQKIDFQLKLVKNSWKIDDIVYGGEAGSLRQWFKKNAASGGNSAERMQRMA